MRCLAIVGLVSAVVLAFAANVFSGPATHVALTVSGVVTATNEYTLEQLQQLPAVTITARDHGKDAQFTGVAMDELLRRAGAPLGEQLHRKELVKGVIVRAIDHYEVLFSLAELDPATGGRRAVLAWSCNGAPLPASQAPLRLVVPDDKRPTRWVRQVCGIEVVSALQP